MSAMSTAAVIGTRRHCIATDGKGVTTLVAFHGCPLRCKYCLNDHCHKPEETFRRTTVSQLVDDLMIDNLYFLATGGGVCFGGGEPVLHSEFIHEFCEAKVPEWKVTIETSLNVPRRHLERLLPHVDLYVIDIKDTNPDIYKEYTGCDNAQVLDNLRWLLNHDNFADRIIVRLPHIPDYNSQADVDMSRERLTAMGVTQFDEFDYVLPTDD